ncbi:hypothetical protein EGR_11034 [Echinococcus granulosus]|uniref:Uncharacterized protein n=1 Tax=Echinococcus granulosus TaxID=6210 RepID=W6U0X4_ECHGR|nr:hypothetical protein EGR_11034 [Echinococcus granulosus]EUB54106.1 hypothetical protein EGR_11034 [Echinococcus granulosus]
MGLVSKLRKLNFFFSKSRCLKEGACDAKSKEVNLNNIISIDTILPLKPVAFEKKWRGVMNSYHKQGGEEVDVGRAETEKIDEEKEKQEEEQEKEEEENNVRLAERSHPVCYPEAIDQFLYRPPGTFSMQIVEYYEGDCVLHCG